MLWLTRISFMESLDDLDTDLLATQRVDAWELYTSMLYDTQLVAESHPVWRSWVGYEVALAAYGASADVVLAARGVGRGGLGMHFARGIEEIRQAGEEPLVMPPWIEDTDVLRSHRSNLVRRWPDQYTGAWRGTPTLMPYLWPFINEDGDGYDLYVSKQEQRLLDLGERILPKKIRERVMNLT